MVFICQILDSWRFAGGTVGNSQLYKTEASWGLLIPLISFSIISIKKFPEFLRSKKSFDNISNIGIAKNKFIINPIFFIFASYAITVGLLGNIILTPFVYSNQVVGKPPLQGIPNLLNKKEFLKGSRKCGVIDTWDPEAWMYFDIQPCLGVFINSVPGMTDNNPFNLDMLNLIKNQKLTIRGFPEINKTDLWPVYQRQYADHIICERIDHAFGMICNSKTNYE